MSCSVVKGDRIRFWTGKYQGEKGWINAGKKASAHRTYVIVEANLRRNKGQELATFVACTSLKVTEKQLSPSSRLEASLRANEDLDAALDNFAALCIECNLTLSNAGKDLNRELNERLLRWDAVQRAKGSKARFRKNVWNEPDIQVTSNPTGM